jgi:hypothetical protein
VVQASIEVDSSFSGESILVKDSMDEDEEKDL